ncbi:MAG: tryptophan synthase subunit alpha [Ignavibacteriaceae bacterium]
MSLIEDYIHRKNESKEKILSVFLTAGFPDKNHFVELALKVLDAGADMLEIGFPFSDPLADGPVIQHSSQIAIENGINLVETFRLVKEIRSGTDNPLIMMGYANPVLSYGVKKFANDAKSAGVNGVIIPDIPIEEYDDFFDGSFDGLDKILLITPTTSDERIKIIDNKSSGFVYCVSVSGTTGEQKISAAGNIDFIKQTYSQIKKNKMLVGFGISKPEDAKTYSPYCDGVIVGSAVIKSLMNDDHDFKKTLELVKVLKSGLV